MPTVVAGLTLLALYGPDSPFGIHLAYTRAAVLVALLFVTLPFVVRSVQPVLLELDHEVEEAAASLGASTRSPSAASCCPRSPGHPVRRGAGLCRSIGEIRSLVLIVGKVQIASSVIFADIESDAPQAAASLSLVLIIVSLIVPSSCAAWKAGLSLSRRSRLSLRAIALLYLLVLLIAPVIVVFFKTFEHGFGVAVSYMTTPPAVSALSLSLLMAIIAVPLNTVFGITAALVIVRRPGRAARLLDAFIDLPFLSPRWSSAWP